MKPFNIELAKAGHPVCTRDGKNARIICFDRKDPNYPILTLIENGQIEEIRGYTSEGKYCTHSMSDIDLMMKVTNRKGWINIYNNGRTSFIYETREDAFVNHLDTNYLDTIKIEWEE